MNDLLSSLRTPALPLTLIAGAALVLMPLLERLVHDVRDNGHATRLRARRWARALQWPGAILLICACVLPAGSTAALCALPWATRLGAWAALGALRLAGGGWRETTALPRDAGLVFGAVGAAWLLADRLGWQPLGFSPDIVRLTAVHFHFAGIVLPVATACALARWGGGRGARLIGSAVVLGVPAVAVGVTSTQLGAGPGFECVAGWLMSLAGMAVAGLHGALAKREQVPGSVRLLWMIAAGSLAFGMMLSALYASRAFALPLPWLDIPWMRALHGMANAVGFGLCATAAWWRLAGPEGEESHAFR